MRRQRVVQQQGTLSEQRLQILDAIGFDFGNEAQITEEWETRFDQLVDWLLWKVRRWPCTVNLCRAWLADAATLPCSHHPVLLSGM